MLTFVLIFMCCVLFVEGSTELICKSSIFYKMRMFLTSLHPFIKKMLSCGYCTSVWMSILPSAYLSYTVSSTYTGTFLTFFLFLITIHRLSNFVHNINDKHFDKFYDKKEIREQD